MRSHRRAPRSTAFRAARARWASISAPIEAPVVEPALEPARRSAKICVAAEAAGEDAETRCEAFELLSAPRGAPDDLAKLHGVGPQLVKKLNDAGIYHYWQLAAMTPADVEKLDAGSEAQRPHRPRRLDRSGARAASRRLTSLRRNRQVALL